eukprot:TRINITY_DN8918_c0_g3_i2.p1 TRINITY_DN8918_c0_g3~~TRINITY_DN8918_c0_g3_i2.p1  ORF type:complete len:191 (-),score=36.57 TRINITY_DN8918_c0_g3_i2:251-823(-)
MITPAVLLSLEPEPEEPELTDQEMAHRPLVLPERFVNTELWQICLNAACSDTPAAVLQSVVQFILPKESASAQALLRTTVTVSAEEFVSGLRLALDSVPKPQVAINVFIADPDPHALCAPLVPHVKKSGSCVCIWFADGTVQCVVGFEHTREERYEFMLVGKAEPISTMAKEIDHHGAVTHAINFLRIEQ